MLWNALIRDFSLKTDHLPSRSHAAKICYQIFTTNRNPTSFQMNAKFSLKRNSYFNFSPRSSKHEDNQQTRIYPVPFSPISRHPICILFSLLLPPPRFSSRSPSLPSLPSPPLLLLQIPQRPQQHILHPHLNPQLLPQLPILPYQLHHSLH